MSPRTLPSNTRLRKTLLALGLAFLVLAPAFALGQSSAPGRGRVVDFPAVLFNDTLFVNVDGAYRLAFDDDGNVWYTTEGGLVMVKNGSDARRVYTHQDGLPSTYTTAVATKGPKVYVATELGVATIDRVSGRVESNYTVHNSELPDPLTTALAVDGTKLWIGTQIAGVATVDLQTGEWTLRNTSTKPSYARAIRRILPTETDVWLATEGEGAIRYNKSTGAWTNILPSELRSPFVHGIAPLGPHVWFGTENGLARWWPEKAGTPEAWKFYNITHGMPSLRVTDVDVVPGTSPPRLGVSTRSGLWRLTPDTGENLTILQDSGILGTRLHDLVFDKRHGDAYVSNRGVSHYQTGTWRYYATGPTNGATNGPVGVFMTAAGASRDSPLLWFGSDKGISAYLPLLGSTRGSFYNFGEWHNWPGGAVNAIDVEGNTTWFATMHGVVGYDLDRNLYIPKPVQGTGNLVYGIDADRGDLWIPVFDSGLRQENLTTGAIRDWSYLTVPPIPDQFVTDVRVQGDDVWIGAATGVIRMHRIAGTFLSTWTTADGVPGNGIVVRVLPDGNKLWLITRDGDVARFDIPSAKVEKVWNATVTPGFPAAGVTAIHKEGPRMWVGTKAGLVRIDIATGDFRVYGVLTSGLVQEFVNGIVERDGILYLSTFSGIARLDIASDKFLPMHERGATPDGGPATPGALAPPNVRIQSPSDGDAVFGEVEIRGSAFRLGAAIDRVEVRIGANGTWTPAVGAGTWTLKWNATSAAPDVPVLLAARAWSGENVSRVAEIVVNPIRPPDVPLTVEHKGIPEAYEGRPVRVQAFVAGDEPLSATLYHRLEGRLSYENVPMERSGPLFHATIPARSAASGVLEYYVEAHSGRVRATSPADASQPHSVPLRPAPRVAAALDGPSRVTAGAGSTTSVPLNLTNVGTQEATFEVTTSGLRAAWVQVAEPRVTLGPGASRTIDAVLRVPASAFSDNVTIRFEAKDATGAADPVGLDLPIEVVETAARPATPTATGAPDKRTPFSLALVPLALAAAALVLGRRRA